MTNWCASRLTKVYSTRIEDFYRGKDSANLYPPGILGVPSAFLGRYREFDMCFSHLVVPEGTEPAWGIGGNPARAMNDFARKMLQDKRFQWLWIIGDDHTFSPDTVLQLLKHDKDIVVPLCCRRTYPYDPTVHRNGSVDDDWKSVSYDWFDRKQGLVNLNDTETIAGNAGMLIKRSVFENMKDPWFEMGQVKSEYGSPDLWFARKAVDAGYDIWLDMEHPIGHVTHMSVWPYFDVESNEWKAEMRYPDDVWGERGIVVD